MDYLLLLQALLFSGRLLVDSPKPGCSNDFAKPFWRCSRIVLFFLALSLALKPNSGTQVPTDEKLTLKYTQTTIYTEFPQRLFPSKGRVDGWKALGLES